MAFNPVIVPIPAAPFGIRHAANIEALTKQETGDALQTTDQASEPTPRVARTVSLSNPLEQATKAGTTSIGKDDDARRIRPTTDADHHTVHGRQAPIRRDSLKRREALLKGKEGSRQRRRWENDRLLNNPWATPPLPSDWEVQPTYPRHSVPYYLAPLWDAAEFQRSVEKKLHAKHNHKHPHFHSRSTSTTTAATEEAAVATTTVPKEVRAKLKRARAAKGLLMDLEEEVRMFLKKWGEREDKLKKDGLHDADSDEEEEIVFVGRNGAMHDSPGRKRVEWELGKDHMVFDGLVEDKGASFGRWLVHSIATYYGLHTWSVTVGDPARREAYVGLGEKRLRMDPVSRLDLPRPLWCMV